jgi:undecaprenyl-diphosphatase
VGGVIILLVEGKARPARVETTQAMTWLDALKVGFAQCFALIPGTSRSGATIIGGMLFGLSRKAATEFSFFLAVPTLIAAGAYDMFKNRGLFSAQDLDMFAVGLAAAFVSAFVVIRWLVRYVATHDFKPFAWYRIVFGLVVLATAYFGWVTWTA